MNDTTFPRLRIGVSACLLGQPVRYDGGHKHYRWLTGQLAEYADFVPICPEVAIGLPVPRPPIHLRDEAGRVRAVGVDDPSLDVTDRLSAFGRQVACQQMDLDGYVLKKDSPSCGLHRVKLYPASGKQPQRIGRGLFAQALTESRPLLPVEEEGRLNDAVLLENFVNRLYVWQRWRSLTRSTPTARQLLDFHVAHKYLLMAHSQAAYRRMGQLLSNLKARPVDETAGQYATELMTALARRVSRKRHANALQHLFGYLKRSIDGHDKQALLAAIEDYRTGQVPLVLPIRLLRDYFRRHPDDYIGQQVYLQPHPDTLGLRNAI